MFSLIVFSLVMFATINRNFTDLFTGDEANAGWDVRADAAGSNPIGSTEDFLTLMESEGVSREDVAAAGSVQATFQISMRRGADSEWKQYMIFGMDNPFIQHSAVTYQQRATGYDDDEAVRQALLNEPNVVVMSSDALSSSGGFGSDPNAFRLDDPDGEGPEQELTSDMKVFDPITIQVLADDGTPVEVKLIGIIDSQISTLFGMFGNEALVSRISPDPIVNSYFMQLSDAEVAEEKARSIESALIMNGVEATSIRDELEEAQQMSTGFLYIFQGFMGLGLIVGIAAVGVIAFRSVVERRQQIGVLRALGYQQSLVSLSFLIETAVIVGLGVISGTVLGLSLAWVLFNSEEFAGVENVDFSVPWGIVFAILAVTIVAALLMTVVPARQASKLAPAEALRYE
jgi:putative ABC transport system permease protein